MYKRVLRAALAVLLGSGCAADRSVHIRIARLATPVFVVAELEVHCDFRPATNK